jgi:hypothetical protein
MQGMMERMADMMKGGSMSPEQMKRMGEMMDEMGATMGQMHGMMGPGGADPQATRERMAEMQQRMAQMQKHMSEMMGHAPSASPGAAAPAGKK